MKNSVGGLFRRKGQARQAYEALETLGFKGEDLMILEQKKESNPPGAEERFPGQSVLISALIGAVIVSLIAAMVALLIGSGQIKIPGFTPNLGGGPFLNFLTFIFFVAEGAVTGAILGAAIRLLTSPHKVEITANGIRRGGVLVVVNVDEKEHDKAVYAMEKAGAADLENLTQTWDQKVWTRFDKVPPFAVR